MTGAAQRQTLDAVPTLWPADRFYWSIIEVPAGTRIRPGPLPIGLRPAFEEDVPENTAEAIDGELAQLGRGLHAVCTSIGRGRVVVCAAPVADLNAVDPAALALCPAELPSFVRDELITSADSSRGGEPDAAAIAASLNLLVGKLEPSHIRAARARRRSKALVTVFLCLGLAAIGLHRRAGNDMVLAEAAAAQADDAARDLGQRLHAPVRVTPDTLPAVLAVAQRSADAAARIGVPTDASIALAALLEHWPREGAAITGPDAGGPAVAPWSCSVQSLAVGGENIGLTVNIDGDAAAFLRALRPPPGWTVEEPRLTSVGRASGTDRKTKAAATDTPASPVTLTRIALTLHRNPASPEASEATAVGGNPR